MSVLASVKRVSSAMTENCFQVNDRVVPLQDPVSAVVVQNQLIAIKCCRDLSDILHPRDVACCPSCWEPTRSTC